MESRTIHRITSFIFSAVLLVFSFFSKLSFLPVRIWDEARNANNAFSLYTGGHWMVPYYQGSPDMWNTKPPLLIWIQALDMHVFGVNEFALRLPAALAAVSTGLLLWWFCTQHLNRPWMGFLSAAVLATTLAYVENHAGRTGDYDALMVLFMTAAAYQYFLFIQKPDGKRILAIWIWLTLAVMTKGIAGLTLLPGLFLYSIIRKKLPVTIRTPAFYQGLLLFLLVTGGYYLFREHLNPGYLKAVYANELGGRYLETLEGHKHPFSFYFDNMVQFRNPYWIYFLLPAFAAGFFNTNNIIRQLSLYHIVTILTFFFIVSAGGTKLEWYELPVYPFLAMQTAILLYYGGQWLINFLPDGVLFRLFLALVLFLSVFIIPARQVMNQLFFYREKPWDDVPHRESYFIKDRLRRKQDLSGYVFLYNEYNGQVYFYIERLRNQKMNVALASSVRDLAPGTKVVVCQPEMEQQLMAEYSLKKLETNFGCTVYLVVSQP